MAKKYVRKTVRRFTVHLPEIGKDGEKTTRPVRLPLPMKGVTLTKGQKREFVDAFIQLYMEPDHNMTTVSNLMGIKRSTLHQWRLKDEELDRLMLDAVAEKKIQRETLEVEAARSTAMKLLSGYKVELGTKKMIRVLNNSGEYEYVVAEEKISEQYVKPSEALIQRRLENDDERWRKGAGDIDTGDINIPPISWVGEEE